MSSECIDSYRIMSLSLKIVAIRSHGRRCFPSRGELHSDLNSELQTLDHSHSPSRLVSEGERKRGRGVSESARTAVGEGEEIPPSLTLLSGPYAIHTKSKVCEFNCARALSILCTTCQCFASSLAVTAWQLLVRPPLLLLTAVSVLLFCCLLRKRARAVGQTTSLAEIFGNWKRETPFGKQREIRIARAEKKRARIEPQFGEKYNTKLFCIMTNW